MNAPASQMFSRPVRSWSNPAPSVSSDETWPRTSITPADGVMIPASACRSVDFPAPLGPITASDSPWTSWNVTPSSAQKSVGRSSRRSTFTNDWRSVVFFVNRSE